MKRETLMGLMAVIMLGSFSCGGPTEPDPDPQVQDVVIHPSTAAIEVTETKDFEATAKDQNGETISASITWRSVDSNIVTVDNTGTATGRSQGVTGIIAEADNKRDSATVVVEPRTPDRVVLSMEKDTVEVFEHAQNEHTFLEATALDDGDTLDVPQEDFTWASQDSSIATVDTVTNEKGNTVAYALGQSPGQTGIMAELRGVRDTSLLVVVGEASDTPPEAMIESPSQDTTIQEGDEITFQGSGTDNEDGTLTGSSLEWASNVDGTIGTGETVSTSSLTANTHTITLTATDSDGNSSQASVQVEVQSDGDPSNESPTATIEAPSQDTTIQKGDEITFQGSGTDPEDGSLSGGSLTWSSDADGELGTGETVTTSSLSATTHTITLTATDSDGASATAQVSVAVVDEPPTISSADPLEELQSATIQGQNFASSPSGNTVTIDGEEATVTAAGTTELTIDVPELGCVPPHDAVVEVATAAGSDDATSALTPAETPISLNVGQQTINTDPANFCLQFSETTSSATYLMGVQSLASSGITPVEISAEAVDGSGAFVQAAATTPSLSISSGGQVPEPMERLLLHRRAEQQLREWESTHLSPSNRLTHPPARSDDLQMAVTGVSEGDLVDMRILDRTGSTISCDDYFEVTARVKEVTAEAIIVADTANPDSPSFTDGDYAEFGERLDRLYPELTNYFGQTNDIDGNDRVVALFTEKVTEGNPNLLGFVWGGDLRDRKDCAASNEGEVFYGRVPDSDFSRSAGKTIMPATIQHELTHVIQFSRGASLLSRVLEAQAQIGEEISGHANAGRSPYNNYDGSVAWDWDDSDTIQWYPDSFNDLAKYYGFQGSDNPQVDGAPEECSWWISDPSPCQARSLWYGVGWSFMRWVSDQFGPSYPGGEQALHRDIIDPNVGSGHGLNKVASTVGEDLSTMMAQWAAALYTDDRNPAFQPGGSAHERLKFSSWDLGPNDGVEGQVQVEGHLRPTLLPFGDWSSLREVKSSSNAYFLLDGDGGREDTAIGVLSQSGTILPADMQIWVVRLE